MLRSDSPTTFLCPLCLEIWEPQPPGTLSASKRYAQKLLYVYNYIYFIISNYSDRSKLYRKLIQPSRHLCPSSTYFTSLDAKQRS
jgi:hypothetical protein